MKLKPFTIHDADGNVVRTGLCQEDDYYKQANQGETITEGMSQLNLDPIAPTVMTKEQDDNARLMMLIPDLMRAIANDDMKGMKEKILSVIGKDKEK